MQRVNRGLAKGVAGLAALLLLTSAPMFAKNPAPGTLEKKVQHELFSVPWLNLFDDISFRVDGNVVTLFGDVRQPWMKNDAGSAVKHIEGVTRVDNEINVLPLSPMDDRIRAQAFRAIFNGPLFRYSEGVLGSIHIVVDNGRITLRGVVQNQSDSQLAYIRANGLSGVFSVKNELQIEK
jgi:hyperosmotically inducible periplasmic protein